MRRLSHAGGPGLAAPGTVNMPRLQVITVGWKEPCFQGEVFCHIELMGSSFSWQMDVVGEAFHWET